MLFGLFSPMWNFSHRSCIKILLKEIRPSLVPGQDVWPCLGFSKSFSFHTISDNNICKLSLTGLLFCHCERPPVLEDVTYIYKEASTIQTAFCH